MKKVILLATLFVTSGVTLCYAAPGGKVTLSKAQQDKNAWFMQAAAEGDLQTMRHLFNAGADVNAQDENGTTPLIAAAKNSQVHALSILLSLNADTSLKDAQNRTAMDWVKANRESENYYYLWRALDNHVKETRPLQYRVLLDENDNSRVLRCDEIRNFDVPNSAAVCKIQGTDEYDKPIWIWSIYSASGHYLDDDYEQMELDYHQHRFIGKKRNLYTIFDVNGKTLQEGIKEKPVVKK